VRPEIDAFIMKPGHKKLVSSCALIIARVLPTALSVEMLKPGKP